MLGTKFKLAQLLALELIHDLPIDDFFMVLRVGSIDDGEAFHHYGHCFDDFVQAMEENKVIMQTFIGDDSGPNGTAYFTKAIEYAVTKLEVREREREEKILYFIYRTALPVIKV